MKKLAKNRIEKADYMIALVIFLSIAYLVIYIFDPTYLLRGIYVIFLIQLLVVYYYFRFNLINREYGRKK